MDKIKPKYISWLLRLLPILAYTALVIIIYYPVFFMGYWAINGSDALNIHLSGNNFVAEAFRHGQLPSWNPNFNLGQPIIDGSTIVFHPALILYLLFNPWLANTVEVLFGLLLTFLGAWYLLRQQGLGLFPAVIGTIVYVLCGPVFFLHSYHLGFMAVLLLPWVLWVFHQHDRAKHIRWLWIAAILCVLAVYSIDSDTLFYLYAGLIIDRLVCLPRHSRRNYAIKWSGVLLLSGLTGLLLYLQLYEWLIYSSRAIKSYAGILNPSFINMTTAILTGQWLKDWPYDPSYFYFGPAAIWLILTGLAKIDKTSYMFRYFLYSLVIPIFYIITRSLQSHYHLSIFNSLDIWRSMFVFCLGLAMVAAVGVRDILQGQRFQQRLTLSVGLATAVLAILSIVYGMYLETRVILSIAAAAILTTVFIKIKRSKFMQGIGVSIAILAAVVIPAINRTVSSPSCAWNSVVLNLTVQPPYIQCNAFMRNLGFYRVLARASDGQNGHWRVSLFGGIDNMTSLVGLKTLPNYTFIYNKGVEENLYLDGLISKGEKHPYWMKLEAAKSSTLGIYGVRFLVSLGNRELAESDNGWLERKDLSWPDHRVWENLNYIGRAYLVSPEGQRKSGVEFLEDKSTSISLRITAEQGDRLVLADLYYPGWQAFVDDEPVATDVYHGCLRSVNLPVGEHTVSWKYNSRTKQIGFFLSAAVLLLLISFLGMLHIPRKRNGIVTKNNF